MRRVHREATERVGANRLGRNGMRGRVHALEGKLLLSYKTLRLEAQHESTRRSCVVDIKLFSGAVAEKVSA